MGYWQGWKLCSGKAEKKRGDRSVLQVRQDSSDPGRKNSLNQRHIVSLLNALKIQKASNKS